MPTMKSKKKENRPSAVNTTTTGSIEVYTVSSNNSTEAVLISRSSLPVLAIADATSSPPWNKLFSKNKKKMMIRSKYGEAGFSRASRQAVEDLQRFLEGVTANPTTDTGIEEQPFASVPLTARDSQRAQELLWDHHSKILRLERSAEIANNQVNLTMPNGKTITMKYFTKVYQPANNHKNRNNNNSTNYKKMPLFIGLHGGGGCPAKINDQQWENHKRIYQRAYQALADQTQEPLLYVCPRAPTNNWNLWHEPHMDGLLDRLLANLATGCNHDNNNICIDTNRVYISGYSAGGDGIYMLAPRMADRFAAASMMAGHPNGVSLRGVYNLPFSLHVGGKDAAYKRNQVAREYQTKLERWKEQEQEQKARQQRHGKDNNNDGDDDDEAGYQHVWPKVYDDKGHWLENVEAPFVAWMARFRRNTNPKTVVWDAGSSRHARFYWVQRHGPPNNNNNKRSCGGGEVRVTRSKTTSDSGEPTTIVVTIDLSKCPRPHEVGPLTLRFRDMDDDNTCIDKPVAMIYVQEEKKQDDEGSDSSSTKRLLKKVALQRTIASLQKTLQERGDPNGMYSAETTVHIVCQEENAATSCTSSNSKQPQLRGRK